MAAQSAAILFLGFMSLSDRYSNPKWFVEAHPKGVRFHKPKKSTNDLGLLYKNQVYRIVVAFSGFDSERKLKRCLG